MGKKQIESISKDGNMRQSNFELLRIVSMILILMTHANFSANGAVTASEILRHPFGAFFTSEMQAISMLGVNAFILISGYFTIKFTLKSLCNFLFTYYFWSIGLYAVSLLYTRQFSAMELMDVLNPLMYNWFIGAYLGLCVFSLALNVFINAASQTDFKKFLIIYLSCAVFIGWLMWPWPVRSIYFDGGFSLLSFIGIYLTGAYIRKYVDVTKLKSSRLVMIILAVTIFVSLLYMGFTLINDDFLSERVKIAVLCNYDSPASIIGSISLFLIFAKLHIRSRFINWAAKSAFVVFIIHFHPFVVPYYYTGAQWIFGNFDYFLKLPLMIIYAAAIYLVCTLADQIRIYLWDKIAGLAYKNTPRQPLA